MKKLLITTCLILTGFFIYSAPLVSAESLKEATFSVGDYLDLDQTPLPEETEGPLPDPQDQSYFTANGRSPIVNAIIMIIDFATRIIGSIAILLLIISGFLYITAQGSQESLDKAKAVFKYTIIGLMVTFLSYIITIFVQSIFVTSGS